MSHRLTELLFRQGASRASELTYDLLKRLEEPERTGNTIPESLAELDLLAERIENPDAVELAIWFRHYVASATVGEIAENELKSAQAWAELASKHGIMANTIEEVYKLILATKDNASAQSQDECYVADLVRIYWGFEAPRFKECCESIRKRFAALNDAEFRARRRDWISKHLGKEHLYRTRYFQDKYEKIARENLTAALKDLGGGRTSFDYSKILAEYGR
jgi:predicted metal-dependent HD superfamily phosphohydrolase